jgi:hypothetical protein
MQILLFMFVGLIGLLLKKYTAFFSKLHGYTKPILFLHSFFLYLGLTDHKFYFYF